MYFYIDGKWARAEDPWNPRISDTHAFEYPPSGRSGTYLESCVALSVYIYIGIYRYIGLYMYMYIYMYIHICCTASEVQLTLVVPALSSVGHSITLGHARRSAPSGVSHHFCRHQTLHCIVMGATQSVMECVCFSQNSGMTTSSVGSWEE